MSIVIHKSAGFTLLEVMIAVLVLAIGLLGLAQLQVTSLKYNQSAYFRSQASNLANDIFERMRANQVATLSGSYVFALSKDVVASPSTQADTDISEWLTLLSKSLPDGDGYISCVDADGSDANQCSSGSIHTVTVRWTEEQDSGDKGTTTFVYKGGL